MSSQFDNLQNKTKETNLYWNFQHCPPKILLNFQRGIWFSYESRIYLFTLILRHKIISKLIHILLFVLKAQHRFYMYFSTIVSNLNTKITKVDLVDQCLTINNCNFLTLARHDIYIVKQGTRAVSTQIQ